MGAAAYGGRGFEGRARVSGERPIGADSCRQQHNQASCHTPPSEHPPPPPPPLHRPSLAPEVNSAEEHFFPQVAMEL